MLIEFSVENFRSCRDVQTISLVADSGDELKDNTYIAKGVAGLEGRRLLKSIAIFGGNATGKSNLIRAMSFFFTFISRSATDREAGSRIEVVPFRLDAESPKKPTRFRVIFYLGDTVYEYSFSVTPHRVESEELVAFPKKIARRLFSRTVGEDGQSRWRFSRTHFHRDRELEGRTRGDALYLSVAAQWNHRQMSPIYEWARGQNYMVFVGDQYRMLMRNVTTTRCIEEPEFCEWVTGMLRNADTGIAGIRARLVDATRALPPELIKQIPDEVLGMLAKQPRAEIQHVIKGTGESVYWGLEEESDGTQQFYALMNAWDGMMHHGRTAVVDELDSSLHSRLSRKLIELLHSRQTNPHGGQVIFTTHDTSLLDPTLLRRDQVYFTEKDDSGATRLYPLLDYKPRKGEALQKGYLAGRYGGVPYLGGFDLGEVQEDKEP